MCLLFLWSCDRWLPGSPQAANGSCLDGEAAVLSPSRLYHSELLGTDLAMPEWAALVTVLSLSAIIVFTVVGNVLVIISVFTHAPLKGRLITLGCMAADLELREVSLNFHYHERNQNRHRDLGPTRVRSYDGLQIRPNCVFFVLICQIWHENLSKNNDKEKASYKMNRCFNINHIYRLLIQQI